MSDLRPSFQAWLENLRDVAYDTAGAYNALGKDGHLNQEEYDLWESNLKCWLDVASVSHSDYVIRLSRLTRQFFGTDGEDSPPVITDLACMLHEQVVVPLANIRTPEALYELTKWAELDGLSFWACQMAALYGLKKRLPNALARLMIQRLEEHSSDKDVREMARLILAGTDKIELVFEEQEESEQ